MLTTMPWGQNKGATARGTAGPREAYLPKPPPPARCPAGRPGRGGGPAQGAGRHGLRFVEFPAARGADSSNTKGWTSGPGMLGFWSGSREGGGGGGG